MAQSRPQSSVWLRVLMGIARVLAAVVVAVAASAALAELDVEPVEFARVLPVVLTGEAILYILMLGGGTVAGPVLVLTLVLAFALRAGVALGASALSPQVGGDLIEGAKFYYASFWPSAAAEVLLTTLLLRLMRPLIARRRGSARRPAARPRVEEVLDDESRDALLAALEEAPDEPPVSPTVLEEQQIGDLAERAETPADEELAAQELVLPFDEAEADPEAEEAEPPAEEPPADEPPLPPGVIDATPQPAAAEGEVAPAEPTEVAPTPEPPEAAPVATEEASPGEDTERLEPVVAPEQIAELGGPATPRNLQEMVDVIAHAAGGDAADVRVWGTTDGRTVIAAVPSGTPAAATAAHADGLAKAHLSLCAWLGADATCMQLAATPLGAYALRALDEAADTMLLMAGRGRASAGRLELMMARTAEAVQGMAPAPAGREPAPILPEMTPLRADNALAIRVADAARAVGGRLAKGWLGYRQADRGPVLVAVPPGADAESLARIATAAAGGVAGFTDALALGAPEWLILAGGSTLLALAWEQIAGERALLVAVADDSGAVGRIRWELAEIARLAAAKD